MKPNHVLATGCAVAGVFVLAGMGWALLAAAACFLALPVPHQISSVVAHVRSVWRWFHHGRRAVAGTLMPVSVVGLAIGLALVAGVGMAIIVASALGVGLAFVLGWESRPREM